MVIALCVGSPGETRSCVLPSPIIIIITPTTHNVVVVVMFVVVSRVRSSQTSVRPSCTTPTVSLCFVARRRSRGRQLDPAAVQTISTITRTLQVI